MAVSSTHPLLPVSYPASIVPGAGVLGNNASHVNTVLNGAANKGEAAAQAIVGVANKSVASAVAAGKSVSKF